MLKLHFYIGFILFVHCYDWVMVCNGCVIKIQGYSPLFVKKVHTHPVVLNDMVDTVQMENGDGVEAHCTSMMRIEVDNKTLNTIAFSVDFECRNGDHIFYREYGSKTFGRYIEGELYISCSEKIYPTLFESFSGLPHCEKYKSYIYGIQFPDMKDLPTVGICYNPKTLTAKYIAQMIYHPTLKQVKNMNYTPYLESINMDIIVQQVKDFKLANVNKVTKQLGIIREQNEILAQFSYGFLSGIPDTRIVRALQEFSNIFSMVWWEGLRFGNWENFLIALDRIREKTSSLFVYMGTQGEAKLPKTNTTTLDIESFKVNENGLYIPEYIWMYLKRKNGIKSEEFVVVAYNSPFGALKTLNSIVFCNDICAHIDWIHSSDLYATLRLASVGIMFCCRPEDAAAHIDDLPYDADLRKEAVSVGNNNNNIKYYGTPNEKIQWQESRLSKVVGVPKRLRLKSRSRTSQNRTFQNRRLRNHERRLKPQLH